MQGRFSLFFSLFYAVGFCVRQGLLRRFLQRDAPLSAEEYQCLGAEISAPSGWCFHRFWLRNSSFWKGIPPLWKAISQASPNLTQSYDYLFNGLNGRQSFSLLLRTQVFYRPILRYAHRLQDVNLSAKNACRWTSINKTKHHLFKKSSIFAKNPQATPYENGEIITKIRYSFPSFGYPIVVKSLS